MMCAYCQQNVRLVCRHNARHVEDPEFIGGREPFGPEHFGLEPFGFELKVEKLNAERLKVKGLMG